MELAGAPLEDIKADVPGVQQALIALQEKKLAWRASRGIYAVEERAIVELLRADGLLVGLVSVDDLLRHLASQIGALAGIVARQVSREEA